MNIVVIGLGSMGKRRIRLLLQNDKDLNIIGIDSRADRREDTEKQFHIKTCDSLDAAAGVFAPEVCFVCTSPLSHGKLIVECLDRGMHVFSEINLSNTMHEEMIRHAESAGKILFISSTPLYRREIEYIKNQVRKQTTKCHYRYHVGQYLPDWHPWENYKDFFVGNRESNGCRELFAIELPWILAAFGPVKSFTVAKDKISSLEIDYPDSYLLLLEHENGNRGAVNMDVVSRKATRELEVIAESLYLKWDGTPDGLSELSLEDKTMQRIELYSSVENDPNYAGNIIENAYTEEITLFFESIAKGIQVGKYSAEEEREMLDLINRIEYGE